jgi:hypothetical protein
MTSLSRTLALILSVSVAIASVDAQQPSIKWEVRGLTVDLNEGIDIADINGDGTPDIIAGRNWYAGPNYTPRPLRQVNDWNGYAESNGDFAHDVDGDGLIDLIAGSFLPTEVFWYRNPGKDKLARGHLWEKLLLADTGDTCNESQIFADLDGDGIPEWIVNSWKKDVPMVAWKLATIDRAVEVKKGNQTVKENRPVPTLQRCLIGVKGNGHGIAVGDLNNDGRTDLMIGQGWYEGPAENPLQTAWKFHPDWDLHGSCPMLVHDINKDGRNDLIVGVAHGFGLHWWEQLPAADDGKLQWKKHLIDDRFSQPHCLHLADLTGDGTPELITGKRVYAHNGGDPGGSEPACLYYWTWDADKPVFERHTIDEGHVGTGLQIRTADLNGDKRLDIAVAGKSGTFVLLNRGTGDSRSKSR